MSLATIPRVKLLVKHSCRLYLSQKNAKVLAKNVTIMGKNVKALAKNVKVLAKNVTVFATISKIGLKYHNFG